MRRRKGNGNKTTVDYPIDFNRYLQRTLSAEDRNFIQAALDNIQGSNVPLDQIQGEDSTPTGEEPLRAFGPTREMQDNFLETRTSLDPEIRRRPAKRSHGPRNKLDGPKNRIRLGPHIPAGGVRVTTLDGCERMAFEIPWEIDPDPSHLPYTPPLPLKTFENYFKDNPVINLSSYVFSRTQRQILARGLGFIPTPSNSKASERHEAIEALIKRTHRQEQLQHVKFRNSNGRPYPGTRYRLSDRDIEIDHEASPLLEKACEKLRRIGALYKWDCKTLGSEQNLTPLERAELELLEQSDFQQNFVIKKADKGSSLVVMDREDYIFESQRQLDQLKYYRCMEDYSIQSANQHPVNQFLEDIHQKGLINREEMLVLKGPTNPRPRTFYLLPKIHKGQNKWAQAYRIPPGRPVISDTESESYMLSDYLDRWLQPLSMGHDTWVKDSYHFMSMATKVVIPQGMTPLLVALDVDSMYTNISHEVAMKCIRKRMEKEGHEPGRPEIGQFLEILNMTLTRNDFYFWGHFFLQINGTAMGKKYAPALANIVMAEWETQVLTTLPNKPLFNKRFLDDLFWVWLYSIQDLKEALAEMNRQPTELRKCIKLTAEWGHEGQVFMDMNISFDPKTRGLSIRPYRKPTDTMQLLHWDSHHPAHTQKGIVKSAIIRYHRLSTERSFAKKAWLELKEVLLERGYPNKCLTRIWGETNRLISDTQTSQKWDPTQVTHLGKFKESSVLRAIPPNPVGQEPQGPCNTTDCILCERMNPHVLTAILARLPLENPPPNQYLDGEDGARLTHNNQPRRERDDLQIPREGAPKGNPTPRDLEQEEDSEEELSCSLLVSLLEAQPDGGDTVSHSNQEPITGSQVLEEEDSNPNPSVNLPHLDVDGRSKLSCRARNVIYMVECDICHKRYVGQTTRPLFVRFTDYQKQTKDIAKKKDNADTALRYGMPWHIFTEHPQVDSFSNPWTVVILRQVDIGRPPMKYLAHPVNITRWLKLALNRLENQFINQLQTMNPNGLNVVTNISKESQVPLCLPFNALNDCLADALKTVFETESVDASGQIRRSTNVLKAFRLGGKTLRQRLTKANLMPGGYKLWANKELREEGDLDSTRTYDHTDESFREENFVQKMGMNQGHLIRYELNDPTSSVFQTNAWLVPGEPLPQLENEMTPLQRVVRRQVGGYARSTLLLDTDSTEGFVHLAERFDESMD